MKEDRFIHKHGYGILFSDKTLLKELIESFVDKDFASEIDFSDYEALLEKSYISKDFRDFADDLFVKVKLNGKEAYIYLLIEFQSSNDHFMSLRILNYILLFYLDFIKENPAVKKLPPVFPLLLYNGKENWTACENIRDLIEPQEFIEQFYPDFRYFKIIEKEYSKERLLEIKNAVAGIFLLENSGKEQFDLIKENLQEVVSNESAQTIALLAVWIKHLFNNKRMDSSIYEEITSIKNEQEAKCMLVATIDELKKDWLVQGEAIGIEKGEAIGIEKGEAIGIEKGKIEDVLYMAKDNLPVDKIVKYTGLSQEKVREILKQHKK